MQSTDVAVIGGGIVGLATAYQLLVERPGISVCVVEKEAAVGKHQTGHNSGVIHSGIYYRPGSLRAENCRAGKALLERFCEQHAIPFERCGKVIVATGESQRPALERIYERGLANGVDCRPICQAELRQLEPHCAGVAGLHVPETGIVDYPAVAVCLAREIERLGGEVACGTRLIGVREETTATILLTSQGDRAAKVVVTCAGLQSDRVAQLCGWRPTARVIPFRGEYFELKPRARHLCRNLIYPVPDPRFPFLGVHFTRMIHGGIECGPNAVWALARESYSKTGFVPRDAWDAVSFSGFRALGLKYWRMGLEEMWRSCSKAAFVAALQKLIPEIRSEDLIACEPGIRAQAVSATGELIDDFLIETQRRMVHVLNAPSPAATASLQIGKTIAARVTPLL